MNIEKYLINEEITIEETLKKIDANGRGVVYVVEDRKVLGVLTDGDIRRYLLKEQNFSKKASEVMNRRYLYLDEREDRVEKTFFQKNKILSVPVLDENKNLTKILFCNGGYVEYREKIDVPVVIMAGGKGSRLKPFTTVLPKPLIPINEKTITEHILDRFLKYQCSDYYMILNYKKNLIKAYFQELQLDCKLNFIEEEEFLGTAGGLKLLEGKIETTFILTNCDVLLEANYKKIVEVHRKEKNILTMVCVDKTVEIPYGIINADKNGRITELIEKPSYQIMSNTGFYVIEPEFLDLIPSDEFIHITDVIQRCLDKGEKVGTYLVDEKNWLDMGQFDELNHMKEILC